MSGLVVACLREELQEPPTLTAPRGPGRGTEGSRPRSGAGWARTDPPRSSRPQEKAKGLAAKPPRLISQPVSLPPENSNQNRKIITPTLLFLPQGRAWAPAGAPC